MSLPILPPINEAILIRHEGDYTGPIEPGMVFAWEPDLPKARELIIVTRVTQPGDPDAPGGSEVEHATGTAYFLPPLETTIWAQSLTGNDSEISNTESRFREAVKATPLARQISDACA